MVLQTGYMKNDSFNLENNVLGSQLKRKKNSLNYDAKLMCIIQIVLEASWPFSKAKHLTNPTGFSIPNQLDVILKLSLIHI